MGLQGCKGPAPTLVDQQIGFKRYEAKHFEVEILPGKIQVAFVGGLPGQPVLEWALDGDMLQGLSFEPSVRFDKGSFDIKERRKEVCPAERIERVEANSRQVVIHGWLCGETPFELSLESEKAGELTIQAELKNSEHLGGLAMEWIAGESEEFYGLGTQFSQIQLKGHRVPLWVEDQGSSAPLPGLLTTQNRYFWLGVRARTVVDLSKKERIRVETWSRRLTFTVWQAPAPLELLEQASLRTGRVSPLPSWAFGTILGVQGGSDAVTGLFRSLDKAGCPVHAFWIQDWCGERETDSGSQLRWHWQPDQDRYYGLESWIRELKAPGFAVLGYINPFLTDDGPLFEEAWEKGYFVKNYSGAPYPIKMGGFDAYLIDLTHPDAFLWYKELIKRELIGAGFSGWMADYGEWLPPDALLFSGIHALAYHNQYAVDWARLNREAIREAGKEGEVAFFSRSAFTLSHHYSSFYWLGEMADRGEYEGLASAVHGLVSGGFSGMAVNHADIGGFTAIKPSPLRVELLQRWIEWSAFTPVFRTHPDLNAQVYDTPELRDFFARFAKVHQQLAPYLDFCMREAVEKGYPMVRHLYLHYPNDPMVRGLDEQYLLGPDLLVAPVLQKEQKTVKAYLPEGKWKHFWSGQVYDGGKWYEMPAPPGEPAVWWRVVGN